MSAVSGKTYWLAAYKQLYPPVPKLGKEDIPQIRKRLAEGATHAQVGREFGVSYVMIRHIRDGKQWAEY